MSYDITIIGAGPAGTTLARLLDKKYKILIIDKRNLGSDNNYTKPVCCGGLLAPDAQNALAHLGLGLPKEVMVGPQMFSVKTLDFDNDLQRYYQRYYMNVDREKFDRWLASLMPDGVETWYNASYVNFKKTSQGYRLKVRKSQQLLYVDTKILVSAEGALSRIREQVFKGMPLPDKYISVQYWYQSQGVLPHFYSIFDREVTNFYSWIIQKDHTLIVGTALQDNQNTKNRLAKLIKSVEDAQIAMGMPLKKEGTLIMRTRKLNQIHLVKDNIALIGEAAGLISPSSAEGISYGLRSGEYLATAINRNFDGFAKHYKKSCFKLKLNLLIKNIKLHAMYQPFLRKWVMKSRLFAMSQHDE